MATFKMKEKSVIRTLVLAAFTSCACCTPALAQAEVAPDVTQLPADSAAAGLTVTAAGTDVAETAAHPLEPGAENERAASDTAAAAPRTTTFVPHAAQVPFTRDYAAAFAANADKYRITWMRTNEGVKPYKVMDDLTFVGVPIFVAGIIAKSEKKSFRQNTKDNKHTLVTDFKTRIDNYTQYFGPAMATGLKLAGVEGRSDWGRYLASTAMSYGIMAILVNGIKYTSKEMRPDGSSRNSWPSGHTATAFAGATILHKEYGMTLSPLYSLAGYTVATATGIMRVLNNRHWVSDVLSGAGIGIMSTELAYALSDVIFKGRGLLRGDEGGVCAITERPSFFSVSMGIGFGSKNLDFDLTDLDIELDGDKTLNMKFGASTAVSLEGAWFFNKYCGIGGRLRVNSMPVKGWDGIEAVAWNDLANTLYGEDYFSDADMRTIIDGQGEPGQAGYSPPLIEEAQFTIKSDHLTEFAADLGMYFNLPLSKRFTLGSKLLVGRSIMQEVDLNATITGGKRDMVYDEATDDFTYRLRPDTYTSEYDYFTMGGNNTFKVGTGLSLTFAYKDNYAWRVFADYDYSRKTYTMTYDPVGFMMDAFSLNSADFGDLTEKVSIKKPRHTFILGGSFTISF